MNTEREKIEFDVLFIGGGPASLAGAIRLMQIAREKDINIEVALIEKGSDIGSNVLSGELEKSYKEMESLCDITRSTSEKKSLGEAFDFIIDQTKNILSFEEIAPLILNKEKKGFVKVNGYKELSIEDREGLISNISLMRHPMNIDELGARGYPWLKSFDGYESISLVPIIKENEVIGVVILLASEHIVFFQKRFTLSLSYAFTGCGHYKKNCPEQ